MEGSKAKADKRPKKTIRRSYPSDAMKNEERFETLIKQSNDVIQLVSPEGRVIYSSDSLKTILGYTPLEIQNVDIKAYIHPDDCKMFVDKWATLLKKDKGQITLEHRVKHKNGSWVWIESKLTNHIHTANIGALLSNFRAITERRESEEQLRESEERLRFLSESMPQKIYTTLPDGGADYFNPQWTEYSGLPIEKLRGMGWQELFHLEDAGDSADRWRYSLETGEIFSIEHRLRRHDGEFRWHISRAIPMRDEQQNIIKWYGSSTDIHDSKLALQREHELTIHAISLTKQREKLIALNASKDEFISLASHQLRTPATIVKQYLNLMLDGYAGELNSALEEMVARANLSNERQIEIVDDLLRVARLDAGKVTLSKHTTNLVPLLQEVVNGHHGLLAERDQVVTISYGQPGISASVDYPRMKMVLENLIDNASKYSPPGKTIQVSIARDKKAVTISIKDEGVGIAAQDIPKLFHKFSRLNNSLSVTVGGTGLGLYWAKRIVDLHGGTIDVESSHSEGSTFTVVLPT